MTELKTLKDLKSNNSYLPNYVHLKNLKAEAVKRRKNCKELLEFSGCHPCGTEYRGSIFRCKGCERDMWFHNLTEEDLK